MRAVALIRMLAKEAYLNKTMALAIAFAAGIALPALRAGAEDLGGADRTE
jgi:hypothetical protein